MFKRLALRLAAKLGDAILFCDFLASVPGKLLSATLRRVLPPWVVPTCPGKVGCLTLAITERHF